MPSGMAALLELDWKAEERDSLEQVGSKIAHIDKPWVWLQNPTSVNKVEEH